MSKTRKHKMKGGGNNVFIPTSLDESIKVKQGTYISVNTSNNSKKPLTLYPRRTTQNVIHSFDPNKNKYLFSKSLYKYYGKNPYYIKVKSRKVQKVI